MYLNKLLLKDFGKFNNKELVLKPGLNVVYATKEGGKTTLRDFVVSMFYGIEDTRDDDDKKKSMVDRKPTDGRGYSGKAYIKKGEKNYLIERSFLKHSRKLNVLDVQSGREEKLKNRNSLYESLIDIDKNTYESMLCMDHSDDEHGKQLADTVNKYVANVISTNTTDINKEKSIDILKHRMKDYDVNDIDKKLEQVDSDISEFKDVDEELEVLRSKIRENDQEFAMETARRKREARKLIQTSKGEKYEDNESLNDELDELAHNSVFLNADLIKDIQVEKPLTDRIWFIILTGIFVIAVITAMVYILPFSEGVRQIFVVCTVLFVIVTIVEGLYAKGIFDGEIQTPSEEEFKRIIYELERKNETYEDVEIDMSFATAFLEKKEEFHKREVELLNKQQTKKELEDEYDALKQKKKSLEREVYAITVAINAVNEISATIQKDNREIFEETIKDIIKNISGNRFTDIKLDNKLRISVNDNGVYKDLLELSNNEIRVVYIAVRICIAKMFNNINMPVIIDNAFDNADRATILNSMKCLNEAGFDQVILLVADQNVLVALETEEMEYNLALI